ncbi:hypothetical protein GGF31_000794 [Allomyces arbusculus]|nr:hypothetical protein GGF31_000794 [Allomyces arbusculus]
MNGAGPDLQLDYYAVLGVDRDADADDVRKAYRREALKYHPDKHQGDARARAEIRFKQLAEAYEVLKDDRLRAAYDRGGHAASAAAARGQEPPPQQQSRSRSTGGDAFHGAGPSPGFAWSAFSTAGAFDPSTGRFRPFGATRAGAGGPAGPGFRTPEQIFREAFGTDFPSMFGGMPSMFGHPHPTMGPPPFAPFGSPFPTPMFAPFPPLPPLGTTGATFTQSFGSSSMATRKSVSTSVVNGVRTTRTVETDASGTTTEETVVEYPDGTKKVEKKVNGVAQAVEGGPRPPIAASSANANGPVPVYVNGQQLPTQGQQGLQQQQQGGYQPVGYQPQQQQQQAQQQQQQYEPYPYAQYPPPQYASPQQQPYGPQYPHYQAPSKSRPNRY